MPSAVLAGLIVSGVPLVLAEHDLRPSVLARCGLMMVALSAGGAILGEFLHVSNILLDERGPMPQGFKILYDIAIPTVAGGIPGSIEGVHSSLPLAWLLGMSGDRTTERADSRG